MINEKLPEANESLQGHLYGNLGAVLTLINDRSNEFFELSTSSSLLSASLTIDEEDVADHHFEISGSGMTKYTSDILIFFNGIEGSEI